MLLEAKNAVVYGAGGPIGGAVARAFAREGAKVFVTGRTISKLDAVTADIRSAGGLAEPASIDALDEAAVDTHADAVAGQAGSIDISINLIAHGHAHGVPLAEMAFDDFSGPVATAVRTTFLTARAAARHMIRQGSGVILMFGGYGPPPRGYYIGGTQVAFQAIEAMRRQFAAELGPHGIRVLTMQTGGIPETIGEGVPGRDEIARGIEEQSLLKRSATLADVGNVAAFAASDRARSMTATAFNISGGAIIDD